MTFCIDDANTAAIRRICDLYPVDGVTTNPSILSKCGRAPFEVLHEIRDIIGKDGELFVQTVSGDAVGMLAESHRIVRELGNTTLIKVPCTPQGFRAMKALNAEGIRFIGTAVYDAAQGFWAAKCGAEYVAPYVNRIDNLDGDGVQTAKDIHDLIARNGFTHSGVLAASFKNSRQVMELIRYGVKGVTVSPDVIDAMVHNAEIDAAVSNFNADFAALCGEGKTMLDC